MRNDVGIAAIASQQRRRHKRQAWLQQNENATEENAFSLIATVIASALISFCVYILHATVRKARREQEEVVAAPHVRAEQVFAGSDELFRVAKLERARVNHRGLAPNGAARPDRARYDIADGERNQVRRNDDGLVESERSLSVRSRHRFADTQCAHQRNQRSYARNQEHARKFVEKRQLRKPATVTFASYVNLCTGESAIGTSERA